jgi:hypothetical protein
MPGTINTRLLCRHWVRSREEDTDTELVYRPAGFPLPPSRGRAGIEFNSDGTFKRIAIGSTDISNVRSGAWKIDAGNVDEVHVEVEGEPQLLKIQELKRDRLTIKRNS